MRNIENSRDYRMKYTNKKTCPYCGNTEVKYISTILGDGYWSADGNRIEMPILNFFTCNKCKDAKGGPKEFIFLGKPVDGDSQSSDEKEKQ
jgi:hypothetical protein